MRIEAITHLGRFFLLLLVLASVCFRRSDPWDRKSSQPTGSIKPERPQDESQRPDGMNIRAIEQKRIGKDDFRATGEVEVRYQDMLLKADEVWGNRPDARR